jgi:MFS family permease
MHAAEVDAIQRRTLAVVVATQALGGTGLSAGVTVGALLAQQMLGGAGYAGLPAAVLTLGSAVTAFLIGRVTQRFGRRPGLCTGFLAGGIGATGVVFAAGLNSVWLLLAALFVYGAGAATNLQARYAGTDLALPERRGFTVSVALVSTTLGAVAGPNLVEPTGQLVAAWGLRAPAGPFVLAAAAYFAAALTLALFLRPDPFVLARRLMTDAERVRPLRTGDDRKFGVGVYAGATVMIVSQIAMTAIMTMTPVHMLSHHQRLAAIGFAISLHVAAMYLPSLLTGILVDRFGRTAMAIASGITLILAGLAAAACGDSLTTSVVTLVLLGLAWNFGLISGTAMIVDATTHSDRARTQGALDVLVALAGAGSSAASGAIVAASSYAVLSLLGGSLALTLIPMLALHHRTRTRQVA